MAQTEETEEVLQVQNISDLPQHIYWEDRRETIYPKQVRSFPASLAREFLAARARFCTLYRPTQMPSMAGASNVWMANCTGNPWLPRTVKVQRKYRGEMIDEEKPHPLRIPFPVKELISRGQTVQPAREGDGDESLNHPPQVVEIPPFDRLLVPTPIAEVMVERDQMRTDGWRGQVIQCRAPSDFEPNETWPYDEVRLYAALIAPELYAEHLEEKRGDKASFPPEASFGPQGKAAVRETRKRLLDMLFFQLIDEVRPYPDRREFSAQLERMKEAARAAAKPGATARS